MAAPPPPSSAQRRAQQQAAWDSYNAQQAAQQAVWSGAAASGAASGMLPSASEVSRVLAAPTKKRTYVIQVDNAVEECFAEIFCTAGLIYVMGGVTASIPQVAAGDCYLGRTIGHLTEYRPVGSQNDPVLIAETGKGELQPCRTYVSGKAGDQVVLIYR